MSEDKPTSARPTTTSHPAPHPTAPAPQNSPALAPISSAWRRPRSQNPRLSRASTSPAAPKSSSPPGAAKPARPPCSAGSPKPPSCNGGAPILADVDPSNATFSAYFADVARPDTDNPAGVAAWLQELIEYCIAERQSALIDLGGGDTTLRSLAAEMPGLAAHIEAAGMAPVMFHLTGPQPEDLLPPSLWPPAALPRQRKPWCSTNTPLSRRSTRERAFSRLTASTAYGDLAADLRETLDAPAACRRSRGKPAMQLRRRARRHHHSAARAV